MDVIKSKISTRTYKNVNNMDDIIIKYLLLSKSKNIKPKEKLKLIKKDPLLKDFFKEIKINYELIQRDLEWVNQSENNHIIPFASKHFPKLLAEITNPPLLLFVKGNISVLNKPKLAIVGSRCASSDGINIAKQFARDLVDKDFVVVSGLALGIDSAAHLGAINKPCSTIAVLGTGLDIIYPSSNVELANKIISTQGAIISEYPIGAQVAKYNFPQRNRIISGLSLGVLVVEAREKSGSLITANFALEQNREVFAVPSSIYNFKVKGCHGLIRQGAKLVENVDHIIEEFDEFAHLLKLSYCDKKLTLNRTMFNREQKCFKLSNKFSDEYSTLLEHLGYNPISVDKLSGITGIDIKDLTSMLCDLELDNYVVFENGGYCLVENQEIYE